MNNEQLTITALRALRGGMGEWGSGGSGGMGEWGDGGVGEWGNGEDLGHPTIDGVNPPPPPVADMKIFNF